MPSMNQEDVEKALNLRSGTFTLPSPAREEVSNGEESSTLILTAILFLL